MAPTEEVTEQKSSNFAMGWLDSGNIFTSVLARKYSEISVTVTVKGLGTCQVVTAEDT